MLISLIGYMGSGKSHISKILSDRLNFERIDLDNTITEQNKMPVSEIFEKKGELYFRKQEKSILEELLNNKDNSILSLGGGTPVYYNNIHLINQKSVSIFLRAKVGTLTQRLLMQKEKRPLIAKFGDEELPEFIAKHLFERNPYYSQAHITIDTDEKNDHEIANEIIAAITRFPRP